MAQQPVAVRENAPAEHSPEKLFRERLRVLTPAPDFTVQDVAGQRARSS